MFGNARLKEAYFEAKIENATLKLEVEALRRERQDFIAAANTKIQEFAVETQRAESFRDRALELEKDKAVLLERLDLLANHLPPAPTQAFNTLSEEAEDADYALHAGLIERDEYEAILAAAGALNTEITFDSDSPRL